MKNYEHIVEMEKILDNHKEITEKLNQILDQFLNSQEDYKKLINYYHSEEFQIDYEKSNNDEFKKEIKCGVLSQDAIYDLIGDNFQTAIKLLEVGTKIIKEN